MRTFSRMATPEVSVVTTSSVIACVISTPSSDLPASSETLKMIVLVGLFSTCRPVRSTISPLLTIIPAFQLPKYRYCCSPPIVGPRAVMLYPSGVGSTFDRLNAPFTRRTGGLLPNLTIEPSGAGSVVPLIIMDPRTIAGLLCVRKFVVKVLQRDSTPVLLCTLGVTTNVYWVLYSRSMTG